MKRLILFMLVALGYSFVSCEPEGDREILPAPEYGPQPTQFKEKANVEEMPVQEANIDMQNE